MILIFLWSWLFLSNFINNRFAFVQSKLSKHLFGQSFKQEKKMSTKKGTDPKLLNFKNAFFFPPNKLTYMLASLWDATVSNDQHHWTNYYYWPKLFLQYSFESYCPKGDVPYICIFGFVLDGLQIVLSLDTLFFNKYRLTCTID